MITGGNATVFVSNMDNAVRFYTEVLGLRLTSEGNFIDFEDPDGNPIYLWEVSQSVPESELVHSAGKGSSDGAV